MHGVDEKLGGEQTCRLLACSLMKPEDEGEDEDEEEEEREEQSGRGWLNMPTD